MFDKKFIKNALPDAVIMHDVVPSSVRISVDTRTIAKGDIFVACKGEKSDGHDFIVQAFDKGASGVILAHKRQQALNAVQQDLLQKSLVICVHDPVQALGKLAAAWRAQFNYPVVGITGSVGKTSTREIVCNILRAVGIPFVSTEGNYNSLIGLPISILNMRAQHQVAVFEVGISKRDEMAQMADILRPTVAAITNVGHTHMEGLGSLLDIAIEKRALFKNFKPENIGIVHGDAAVLSHVGYAHPVIRCGAKSTNQVQARKICINSDFSTFTLKIYKTKYPVRVSASHEGAILNATIAAGIGCALGLTPEHIVQGVQVAPDVKSRFELLPLKRGNGSVINDCYNASPESMKAALLAMEHIKTQAYKIAILGDMLELGVETSFWHRQVGRYLRKTPSIQEVVLVGSHMSAAVPLVPSGIKVTTLANAVQAAEYVQGVVQDDLLVLVKASHGMHLEAVVNVLTDRPMSFAGATRACDDAFKDEQPVRRTRVTS